ncbi:MAG: rod shape-determining protein RodA [Bacteroidales bacterium]
MTPKSNILKKLDWPLIIIYFLLVIIGWVNIYAVNYDPNIPNMFALSIRSGSQLMWICIGIILFIIIITMIPSKLFISFSWWLYFFSLILLAAVLFFGKEINGSKSWFMIGPLSFQPSEISKISTSLLLASVMGKFNFKLSNRRDFFKAFLIIGVPILLIALEPDFGTVLVYCGLILVFYREGMTGWVISLLLFFALLFILTLKFSTFVSILFVFGVFGLMKAIFSNKFFTNIIKYTVFVALVSFIPRLLEKFEFLRFMNSEYYALIIGGILVIIDSYKNLKIKQKYINSLLISCLLSLMLIFSVRIIYDKVLKEHHRDRIENLLGITHDLRGAGYNVNQSKIAIGSGGLSGKGFLQGTQTKFDFVPEQSTDFIFCTIGEEWGFVGSFIVVILYLLLILKIISLAEKQKERQSRIYGYCVASCFFVHSVVNIGMTLGLFPVVGIPLPFISYGGSSFITFSLLLFIFIKIDLERWK